MDQRSTGLARPAMSWEMLEKSLAHPNALVREKAIESAGRFPDCRVVTALQRVIREGDSQIRSLAALALVEALMRHEPAIDEALAGIIAAGEDQDLRVFLITHAAASGSETLLREVILRLVDADAAIRSSAEQALKARAGWMLTNAAVAVLPEIEAARQSLDPAVSTNAAALFEQFKRAQLRRSMLDSGVATILTLTAALRSTNALIRATAAAAMRDTADPRALPVLREALRDVDETVRRAAALALGALKWQPGSEEDLAYFLVALGRWPAALKLGSTAVDALILAAARSSQDTQVAAIHALAEAGSIRAMAPLVKLLEAPEALVRRAAAQGLKILEWVPVTTPEAIRHAIELEDWAAAISFGADAIAPLMTALKASHEQPEWSGKILGAMMALEDPGAADVLVPFCRDGEVAGTAVAALEALMERRASELSAEALDAIGQLKSVVQFQFSVDPTYGRRVRKGMSLINIDGLRGQASAELARRRDAEAVVCADGNGMENL